MATAKRTQSQRGGAMVETALVLLPLVLLLFGIVTAAHAVYASNQVAWLAQEAARWSSVRGADSQQPADAAAIASFTKKRATGLAPAALSVTSSFTPDNKPGSAVSVTVTYDVTPLAKIVWPQPVSVRGSAAATIHQ